MAEREQTRPAPAREEQEESVDEAPATTETGEKIKAELDDLIDEIDEVLETNAEDFVKGIRAEGRRHRLAFFSRQQPCHRSRLSQQQRRPFWPRVAAADGARGDDLRRA